MKFKTLALSLGLMAAATLCMAQKNVIVMIMDGGGFNQYASGNIYETGNPMGIYSKFPVKLAVSTYPYTTSGVANGRRDGYYDPSKAWTSMSYPLQRPTDSAASATAIACGVKTYNGAIGLDRFGNKVPNLIEKLMAKGKSGGVVTTVTISHATPAGFSAHSSSRGNAADIANEQIFKSNYSVIMGCGHPLFDDSGNKLAKPDNYGNVGGKETWDKIVKGDIPLKFIDTRKQFQDLASGKIKADRVLGVAQASYTLSCNRAGDSKTPYNVPLVKTTPTLAEMAKGALNVLSQNKKGFALMIEGGAIDSACHGNNGVRAVEEADQYNQTVEAVMKWVESHGGWKDTLLVCTADHETGFLWGTGSSKEANDRPNLKPVVNNGKGKMPGVMFFTGGHSNSLVPIFAIGAGSERLNTYATKVDPVRGKYLDNIYISKAILDE